MQKSKLIEIMSLFTISELKELKLFIKTSIFKPEKETSQISKLLSILIKTYPNYKNLNKSSLFKSVYPKQSFDSTKMNRLMGRTTEVLKTFILFREKYDEKYMIVDELLFAKFYNKRKAKKLFDQNINSFSKWTSKNENSNKDFLLNYYLFQKEISHSNSLFNQRSSDLNLPRTQKSLDHFYYQSSLEHICYYLAQHQFSVKLETDEIIKQYEQLKQLFHHKFNQVQIIAFELSIELLIKMEDQSFEKLDNFLEKMHSQLPLDRLKSLMAIRRNFCVFQYSRGAPAYHKKAFDCYKKDLNAGYLYHNGSILSSTLQSITKIAIKSGTLDWVSRFLKDHEHKLVEESNAVQIFKYNFALVYFEEGQYEKCLDQLEDNYEDIHYKTSAKRLEIKCYQELNSPILSSKVKAFKIFIYRISQKKLTDLAITGNNNFIDFLKQINNPSTFKNANRIQKIEEKIKKTKILAERSWLIQQLQNQK
jgi:hypothetical protein